MESHVMSWNSLIGLVGTGIILYLGDLIIRYRQRHCEQQARD
jgi:hypothetical protein